MVTNPEGSTMPIDPVSRSLLNACHEFHRAKPWQTYGSHLMIGLRLPGEDHLIVASIMGSAGQEFGLQLFRGADAPDFFRRLQEGEAEWNDQLVARASMLSFSMKRAVHADEYDRKILAAAGTRFRRDGIVPTFISKRPGQVPRLMKKSDRGKLALAIRAILKADAEGLLSPRDVWSDAMFVLNVDGPLHDPDIEVESIPHASHESPAACVLDEWVDSLQGFPRKNESWEVKLASTPLHLEDISEDEFDLQTILVLVDHTDGHLLDIAIATTREPEGPTIALLKAMGGQLPHLSPGLPREVLLDNEFLHGLMAPTLGALDIDCRLLPSLLFATRAADSLDTFIASNLRTAVAPTCESVPAPKTAADWLSVSWSVTEKLEQEAKRTNRWNARAEIRFFGCTTESIVEGLPPQTVEWVHGAFLDWLYFFYRPTYRSRTLSENLLRKTKALSDPERAFIDAFHNGSASMFEAESTVADESVTLINVLDGTQHTVFDPGIAQVADKDLVFVGQLFTVGEWKLFANLSPPFDVSLVREVTWRLEQNGAEFRDSAIVRGIEATGRLWPWMLALIADSEPFDAEEDVSS